MAADRKIISELAVEGSARLEVSSSSMNPYLQPGDLVQLQMFEGDPKKGDILAISRNNKILIHRFIEKTTDGNGDEYFITKGDGSPNPDKPWRREDIVARVERVESKTNQMLPDGVRKKFSYLRSRWRQFRNRMERKKSVGSIPQIPSWNVLPDPYEDLFLFLSGGEVDAGKRIVAFLQNQPNPKEWIGKLRITRTLGLLVYELKKNEIALPEWLDHAGRAEYVKTAERRERLMLHASIMREVAVDDPQFKYVFIKGLPIGLQWYENDWLRVTADNDVVVEKRFVDPFLKKMDSAGWQVPYANRSQNSAEERGDDEIHYEPRFYPKTKTGVEVHAGRYTAFNEWNWDRLFVDSEKWLEPWSEMGPQAYRLKPEMEFVLAALHAVSHAMKLTMCQVPDLVRMAGDCDKDKVVHAAQYMKASGVTAVFAQLLAALTKDSGWQATAGECWNNTDKAEKKLGQFAADYFWAGMVGQKSPPYWNIGSLSRLMREACYMPPRTAERNLKISRDHPEFSQRRRKHLIARWIRFLGIKQT